MRRPAVTRTAALIGAGCLVVSLGSAGFAVAGHSGGSVHHPSATAPAPSAAASAPASTPAVTASPSVTPSHATAAAPDHQQRSLATPVVKPAVQHVPALHHLTAPDAVVSLSRTASPKAVHRLASMSGVTNVAALDRGTVTLHHRRLHVFGVPLATIRGFTPKVTATSKRLWRSVARGELTVSYTSARPLRHSLGKTYAARGRHAATSPLRLGAFATLDIANAQAIVSNARSHSLGLSRSREVLVAAPKISLDALHADIARALGSSAQVDVVRPEPVDQSVSSAYSLSTIPASYLDLYRRAAVTCPGLPWTVLAGIGTVETGNGRNVHRSTAGAEGPMQFIPSTWAMYGYDADGDGKADINDPVDAVFSAARYLCAAGASRGGNAIDNAIFSYNHAWWYVREVLVLANRYA